MQEDREGFFARIRPNAEWDLVKLVVYELAAIVPTTAVSAAGDSFSGKVVLLLFVFAMVWTLYAYSVPPVLKAEWRSMSDAFKGLTEIEGRYKLFLASDTAEWTFDHGAGTNDPGKPILTFMEHATKAGAMLRRAIGDSKDPGYPALSFWINVVMRFEAHDYPTRKYLESGSRIEQGTVEDLCSKSAYLCVRLEHEEGLMADVRRWNTEHKSKAKRVS